MRAKSNHTYIHVYVNDNVRQWMHGAQNSPQRRLLLQRSCIEDDKTNTACTRYWLLGLPPQKGLTTTKRKNQIIIITTCTLYLRSYNLFKAPSKSFKRLLVVIPVVEYILHFYKQNSSKCGSLNQIWPIQLEKVA